MRGLDFLGAGEPLSDPAVQKAIEQARQQRQWALEQVSSTGARTRRALWAGLGVAAAVAATGGGYLYWRHRR